MSFEAQIRERVLVQVTDELNDLRRQVAVLGDRVSELEKSGSRPTTAKTTTSKS